MKKIIDGKMYNTETATRIGNGGSPGGVSRSDFNYYYDEDLYRTKKGAFFLVGEGGPMTKYSRNCGDNCFCGGNDFFVLSDREALAWCERNDVDTETIQELFKIEEA